jgi:hypothetical protein
VVAVDRVSFTIQQREIVSLVGQSGCGKTVLARLLLRLEVPTSGELYCRGRPIAAERDPRVHWRTVQAVFQDPFSAFNQFFPIRTQLRSAFHLLGPKPSRKEMDERVDGALRAVNILPREIEARAEGRMVLASAHCPLAAPIGHPGPTAWSVGLVPVSSRQTESDPRSFRSEAGLAFESPALRAACRTAGISSTRTRARSAEPSTDGIFWRASLRAGRTAAIGGWQPRAR